MKRFLVSFFLVFGLLGCGETMPSPMYARGDVVTAKIDGTKGYVLSSWYSTYVEGGVRKYTWVYEVRFQGSTEKQMTTVNMHEFELVPVQIEKNSK